MKLWILLFCLVAVPCAAMPCHAAEATVFPGSQWAEATPESQGVDSAKLNEAAELLARTVGADGARELVVIRHGRMIWKGDNIDKRHGVWSATKSFTSTVLGLLIADGKCTLDTRVADVLPELKTHYPDVTLRHFTTMTSGYRAVGDETTGSYKHGPSNTPFVPNPKPLFTPPGSQYAYWDSAMNTLGLALTKIAGEPIEQLFKRRVADRYETGTGATMRPWTAWWSTAARATATSTSSSPRTRWRGSVCFPEPRPTAKLVPESWIAEATRVQVPATLPWAQPESEIDGRGVYCFNWWRNGLIPDGMPRRREHSGLPATTITSVSSSPNGTWWSAWASMARRTTRCGTDSWRRSGSL
jgi:CubicO group peptidase (beta-lactamase class C family)